MKQIDVFGEFHAAKLFDVGVGACRFVGHDGFDLSFAEEPAFGIDLLGCHQMAFPAGLTQEVGRAGEEGDVAGLERLVRDISLGLESRMCRPRPGEVGGLSRSYCGGSHCNAAQKVSACYVV